MNAAIEQKVIGELEVRKKKYGTWFGVAAAITEDDVEARSLAASFSLVNLGKRRPSLKVIKALGLHKVRPRYSRNIQGDKPTRKAKVSALDALFASLGGVDAAADELINGANLRLVDADILWILIDAYLDAKWNSAILEHRELHAFQTSQINAQEIEDRLQLTQAETELIKMLGEKPYGEGEADPTDAIHNDTQ